MTNELIKKGHLYILETPLFRVRNVREDIDIGLLSKENC